jgi:hypothetical protein
MNASIAPASGGFRRGVVKDDDVIHVPDVVVGAENVLAVLSACRGRRSRSSERTGCRSASDVLKGDSGGSIEGAPIG